MSNIKHMVNTCLEATAVSVAVLLVWDGTYLCKVHTSVKTTLCLLTSKGEPFQKSKGELLCHWTIPLVPLIVQDLY